MPVCDFGTGGAVRLSALLSVCPSVTGTSLRRTDRQTEAQGGAMLKQMLMG